MSSKTQTKMDEIHVLSSHWSSQKVFGDEGGKDLGQKNAL